MKAVDIMVRDVITIGPDESVARAARLMSGNDVSALPVVDAEGGLVGIISEADLLRREEIDTADQRPWWLESVTPAATLASEFVKAHGKRVADLMSENVISVGEDASLNEVAAILEVSRIKRVPVVRDNKPVGIVSRANLIQALASAVVIADAPSDQSRSIREELLSRLSQQPWTNFGSCNVIVKDGEVHLWGFVGSESERTALVALAESVPGVTKVIDKTVQPIVSDDEPIDHGSEDSNSTVATAATVVAVGIGVAAFEAALLPAVVLGAAAAWLPRYFPKIGEALNPLFRSTVRGAYKIGQKAREIAAKP